ncbi:hypothetical protein ThvES_00017750, partial [Thiovulum sp. ES]
MSILTAEEKEVLTNVSKYEKDVNIFKESKSIVSKGSEIKY